jgi:hypothetical protein
MRDDSCRAQAASAVLAALMLTQSALGLLFPGAYRDVAWIRATRYGNDWVTLAVTVPALAGALLLANVRPEAAMRPLEPLTTPSRAAPRSSRARRGRRRALRVTHDESCV